jgi:CheY-like chemotaxis protein
MTSPAKPVVLIVDDEKAVAETLSAIMKSHGFLCKAVYSGEAALAESDVCPDIVVTDVMMPGISGIELAIRLRESRPDCRVLLMSGAAATASLLDDAHERGHQFEILAKPFHPSRLIEWIHTNRLHGA